MNGWDLLIALGVGVGLAAATGFRVFVPLLVMAIAVRTGQVNIASNLEWLTGDAALIALSIATALEIGGYYVPWIDNLLDTVATPAAAVAGTLVASSMLVDMDPMLQWALGAIAGGGTALGVQGLTVGVRALSTASTGGVGNPVVATAETGTATGLAVLALTLPLVAVTLVIVGVIVLARFVYRHRPWRRVGGRPATGAPTP